MRYVAPVVLLAIVPLLVGAEGDGCASSSRSDAPNVSGDWTMLYDDMLEVTIGVGGQVYEERLSAEGGVIAIMHDGNALSFNLDCALPEVVCPSEAWPETISISQQDVQFEHRMIVTLPEQRCLGTLVVPEGDACGEGTLNPDCDLVCDGEIRVSNQERFGVIGESGESFRIYLGAGIATNGVNCALLGLSLADASLENEGTQGDDNWRTVGMNAGLVTVGYGGACLWAGDPDLDSDLEALVLGASVEFRTGFTGVRQ